MESASALYDEATKCVHAGDFFAADALYVRAISAFTAANPPSPGESPIVPPKFLISRASNLLQLDRAADALAAARAAVAVCDVLVAAASSPEARAALTVGRGQALLRQGIAQCRLAQPAAAVASLRAARDTGASFGAHESLLAQWLAQAERDAEALRRLENMNNTKDNKSNRKSNSKNDTTSDESGAATVERAFERMSIEEVTDDPDNNNGNINDVNDVNDVNDDDNDATQTADNQDTGVTVTAPASETATAGKPALTGLAAGVTHRWYDTGAAITLAFYAKNVPAASVAATLASRGRRFAARFTMPDGSLYSTEIVLANHAAPHTALAPGAALSTLAPAESLPEGTHDSDVPTSSAEHGEDGVETVTPLEVNEYKVIFKLLKRPARAGESVPLEWARLEAMPGDDGTALVTSKSSTKPPVAASTSTIAQQQHSASAATSAGTATSALPAAYSGNLGRRDWAAVDAEAAAAEAEALDKGGAEAFLRDLYQRAGDDTKRAMQKSFQTSGGTVLSTNWQEVSETDYSKDIKPPDGMVYKKWD